jgi:hypothetical protein
MEARTSEALCRSCGFCCDGTLFRRAWLKDADAVEPLQANGVEIETLEFGRFFRQPCGAYREESCQVYSNRPACCHKYRCELLKKYEDRGISWSDAQREIRRAKMFKESLMAEVRRLIKDESEMSFDAVLEIIPSQGQLAADRALRRLWGSVTLRLAALLDCLQTHFKKPGKAAT